MTEVSSTTGLSSAALSRIAESRSAAAPARAAETTARAAKTDAVEISDTARLMGKLKELPDVRQDLVNQVRREIALDRYDTPERLDAALDRMIDETAEIDEIFGS